MVRSKLVAVMCSTALFGGAVAAPVASAQNQQDGLVNVFVGEVAILNDADIGVAAQLVAQVCGVKVGPIAVLGRAVDRTGESSRVICQSDQGPVTIRQN